MAPTETRRDPRVGDGELRPPHRIALVTNGLARGGAELQLLHLARGLVARGDEVGILSILRTVEFEGVDESAHALAFLDVESRALPRAAVAVASGTRLLRAWAPDTIVSFVYQANVLGRCAGRLANVPTVVSSIRNEYFGGRARDAVLRATDRLASVTTTNSRAAATGLVARGVVPADRILVVPNAVDTARIARASPARAGVRGALGVDDEFLWLAVARLEPQKDYEGLLHAMSMLTDPRVVLAIAGSGSQHAALERSASAFGVASRVRFLGQRDDVPELLAAADGFVLSSAWEGSPNAVLEAMAAGLPVVATDVGGVGELVEPRRTGSIVAPHAPGALAAAMRSITALGPDHRRSMGARARRTIEERHSIPAVLDAWFRVLDACGASTRRHRRAVTRSQWPRSG